MEKTYTIYEICGDTPSSVDILVHRCDSESPDDWELFAGAVFRKEDSNLQREYFVDEWLTWMWRSPSDDLFISTSRGRIHFRAGGAWHQLDLDEPYSLNRIWGLGSENIFSCGGDGVLLRKTEEGWNRIQSNVDTDFVDMSGTAPSDMYIVGKRGKIWHFDSTAFVEIEPPTDLHQVAVLAVSPEEVYTCGRRGTCFRGSKAGWQRIEGTEENLWDLAQYHDRVLVAARHDGVLAVEGDALVPFAEGIVALGLAVVGDHLFAFSGATISEFDGTKWSTVDLDFSSVAGV